MNKLLHVTAMFLGLLIFSHSAPGFAIEISKNKPTLVIHGVIGQGNILTTGEEMVRLADKGTKEVQLIINSPGGSVTTGLAFLSMMDAARGKGMKVTCFVPQLAASMAFQILIHCDERHTLNNAFLLWHRARVNLGGGIFSAGVAMTAPKAKQLYLELETIDDTIFREVIKSMGKEVSAADLSYHFEVETLHVGINLHKMAPRFITTHEYIPGLFEQLDKTKKSKEGEEELSMSSFKANELIYISDRLVTQ